MIVLVRRQRSFEYRPIPGSVKRLDWFAEFSEGREQLLRRDFYVAELERMAARLLRAFEMRDEGVQRKREALQQEFPSESAEQFDVRIGEWLAERPGAEHGDAERPRAAIPRRT